MNTNKSRYVYVVNPGSFGGTPFFAAYEVESLVAQPDALPDLEPSTRGVGLVIRDAWRSVVGSVRPVLAGLRHSLRRRAARALGTAA